jgi:hypothetical protein
MGTVSNFSPGPRSHVGWGFSLTVNFPVRDDLPCSGYLLDLSLHRRSYARHHLEYGALELSLRRGGARLAISLYSFARFQSVFAALPNPLILAGCGKCRPPLGMGSMLC